MDQSFKLSSKGVLRYQASATHRLGVYYYTILSLYPRPNPNIVRYVKPNGYNLSVACHMYVLVTPGILNHDDNSFNRLKKISIYFKTMYV